MMPKLRNPVALTEMVRADVHFRAAAGLPATPWHVPSGAPFVGESGPVMMHLPIVGDDSGRPFTGWQK